ncbi:MAG: hypothetical protein JWO19_2225 [Bryobacterales bacterium]|jgi:chaperonin cofactor prefoldin|nr:hypothetical protein [Bryobacterales bacterium]
MQDHDSNPVHIRQESESDSRWEWAPRVHHLFTAGLILLGAVLASAAWYAYPILGRHDVMLSQIPDVQKNLFSLGEQVKATAAKVEDWSSRQEELRGRLNKARGELTARIDYANKPGSDASTALAKRVRSEVGTEIDSLKAQLGRVEASREGDREQIARLQQELTQAQDQLNPQSSAVASVQSPEQNPASAEPELPAATSAPQRPRRDFDAYSDKFAVKRWDFEVTNNHGTQVAPGISLHVNGTDVSYQRVNGSIWVTPDRRTIMLRQLKVQEPVFLSFADGRTRELVITRVNKDSVVGYMLVPGQTGATSRTTSPVRAE